MWENLEINWQLVVATLGLTSGIGIVSHYVWRRFTRRLEQSDLESRTNQLEKVTELVELRKKIDDKDGSEALLIQVILKTTVATEILKLSRQINTGNRTLKYVLIQIMYASFGVLSAALTSITFVNINGAFNKIISFIGGVVLGLLFTFLYMAQKEQRRASFEFISSALSSRDKEEDINKIINLALGGEQFVKDKKGLRGFVLAEKVAKEPFEDYLPDDSPLLSPEASAERKRLALEREASAQTEPPTTAQKNPKHPFSPLIKLIRCLSTKKQ